MKQLTIILVLLFLISCEPLDLSRVIDTRTDNIEVNGTSVIAHGTVLDLGTSNIADYGHCWSTKQSPTIADLHTNFGTKDQTGGYKSELHSIMPGKVHYVRSYVYDGSKYVYGEEREFSIKAADIEFFIDEIEEPEEIGNILVSSSTKKLGSMTFSQHGHCWSRTDPPTIKDNISSYGLYNHDTTFISKVNNLNLGEYYIRGYLREGDNVVYTKSVKYSSYVTIATGNVVVQAGGVAIVGGEVNSLGEMPIIEHGHCWSAINPQPNINTTHSKLGKLGSLGVYNSTLQDLLTGVTYYVRAYAFDGKFYYYGEIKSFEAN